MAATIPQAVATARRVFQGKITREQMASLSRRERAVIGLAIMLAMPDDFLDDTGDGALHPRRNDLAMVLYDICGRGIDRHTERDSWLGACRALGLYARNPGRGGMKIFALTPPPEVQALVNELGVTPAVAAFKEAADAALKAEEEEDRLAREKYEARVAKLRAIVDSLTESERTALGHMLKGDDDLVYFYD